MKWKILTFKLLPVKYKPKGDQFRIQYINPCAEFNYYYYVHFHIKPLATLTSASKLKLFLCVRVIFDLLGLNTKEFRHPIY